MDFLHGTLVPEEIIGRGGFATVYRTRHITAPVQVAVKVIDKTRLDSETRFLSELAVLKQINHPFIAKHFFTIESPEICALGQEYVAHGSLFSLITRTGALPELTVRRYFVQLVCALDHLHNVQGVAHRDLSLDNILLDTHNNVRLIDFGLSRPFPEDGNLFTTMCGSYPYMAPEIIASGRYTQAADVWSLGIVLYAMATARFPFAIGDVTALCQEIVTRPIDYPSNLSRGLIDLLSRMLCRDSEERITIDQIKLHSWFPNEQYNAMVHAIEKVFLCGSRAIDREVIELMELDGLDCSKLCENLESGQENDITVVYNVYLRQKQGEWMKRILNGTLKYSLAARIQQASARGSNNRGKSINLPPPLKRIEGTTRKRRFPICPICPIWRIETTPRLLAV
jgi:serine/threonine protein kinase